jgi:hypothetical protein
MMFSTGGFMTEKERVYKLLWELSKRDDMVIVHPYELRILLEDVKLSKETLKQVYLDLSKEMA